MWLVIVKALYNSSCILRVLFWIIIFCGVIKVIYDITGLKGVIVAICLFACPFIILRIIEYLKERKSEKDYKKNLEEEENKKTARKADMKEQSLLFPKLSSDYVAKELRKILMIHPDAYHRVDFYRNRDVHRVYWFEIGKQENSYNNEEILGMHFSYPNLPKGIIMSITNKSSELVEIEWPSLKIDNCGVKINNVDCLFFMDSGLLESGTKMKKEISFKENAFKEKYYRMMDLKKYAMEPFVFRVTFNAEIQQKMHVFSFDVYGMVQLIK